MPAWRRDLMARATILSTNQVAEEDLAEEDLAEGGLVEIHALMGAEGSAQSSPGGKVTK